MPGTNLSGKGAPFAIVAAAIKDSIFTPAFNKRSIAQRALCPRLCQLFMKMFL